VVSPEVIEVGRQLYHVRCAFCHGDRGAGDGPVARYLNPRPRDFTGGVYKLRTTATGEAPTDADLFDTISRGIPGTAMPAWDTLTEEQRWSLVYSIKTFSLETFELEIEPQKAPLGKEIRGAEEMVGEGRMISILMKCWQCHGKEGRGDGPSAMELKDDWGNLILPTDLTEGWKFKGGSRPIDISTRFSTGMNGTPMPDFTASMLFGKENFADMTAYTSLYNAEEITQMKRFIEKLPPMVEIARMSEEQQEDLSNQRRWTLAHYVRSLIEVDEERGPVDVVMKVEGIEDDLPEDPDNPLWQRAKRLTIPLAGQLIAKPRWQNIAVFTVHLRALYNGKEIAFLIEWNDRTKNSVHTGPKEATPEEVADTYPVIDLSKRPEAVLRDAVALQFPVMIPTGPEKPHFFRGEPGKLVNLWHWKSDWQEDANKPSPIEELNAAGYKHPPTPQPAEGQQVRGKGVWRHGRWQVVLRRALRTKDKDDIQFEQGGFIPVAVQVWDGSNNEVELKMSLSSWYYLLIEMPTPYRVYTYSLAVVILAIGLELWLVRKVKNNY
jgi:mono/diheme cytochrome c family protein